ncbi:MAG: hypothetical protein RR603_03035 [Kurthia sp.]
MSLSKDFMREQFIKHLKDNKQPVEINIEAKELFTKSEYLGHFPTIEEAEKPDILRRY